MYGSRYNAFFSIVFEHIGVLKYKVAYPPSNVKYIKLFSR